MNFYGFNIGDYASKTRHLSWDEDLAYRRLLDVYYGTEKPLPVEKAAIYRLVMAQNSKQKQAVDAVLSEFFALTDAGWRNARADEEIAAYQSKREKAAQSARKRWGDEAQSEGNAGAMRSHSEGNAPTPNPTPTPTPNKEVELSTRARPPDLEARLREAAGWQSDPSPNLLVTGPIEGLLSNGADLELDVLPVIRAIAPKARGRSWKFFTNAIARARDDRIAAATTVSKPNDRRPTHVTRPSRSSTVDAILENLGERPPEGGPPVRDVN